MASSSSLSLLISDFQALASETKRRHADVKEASDKALGLLKSTPDEVLSALRRTSQSNSPNLSDDIFKPIIMACASKNSKVVVIALGSLQRLIGMDATPPSKIPQIINLLSNVLPLGVDIQLRILQTLPSLFTRCSKYLHDSLLADALLLCFRLQDSRIAVVSSTSAATLRQLVMVVFEGVAEEDKAINTVSSSNHPIDYDVSETDFIVDIPPFESIHLNGETERTDARKVALRPSARDAYLVFEDLCLLVNGDSPSFLKLQSLPKTFGLELIESVMTGHAHLFQQHPELIFVLRAQLCPLLIKALTENPAFPLTLRLMRVAFLLLKQFSDDLLVEAEIFLSMLLKTISHEQSESHTDAVPTWYRVLALETFRGLCADFGLLLRIFERYDMRQQGRAAGVFTTMMGTFNRLASERPALLGINQDITGGSLPTFQSGSNSSPGVQGMIDGVVGMATQAAAPLVGTNQGGLTLATAAMKLQCIDQLDKAEAPIIPETYVYLLALQCLSNVAEGFAGFVLVQAEELLHPRSTSTESSAIGACVLDFEKLAAGPNAERLKISKSMADASWPALLASLNFFISTNLDDQLFSDTLVAMQNFTYVCGILHLTTPRDAFLLSFCKFAIPPAIVANVAAESSGPASNKPVQSVLNVDSLGLGTPPAHTSLSSRNFAFLRTLLAVAQYLSGVLGSTWYTIFETLQNADYVLSAKLKRRGALSSNTSAGINESEESVMLASIQKLFDCTRTLDQSSFSQFIAALCRLSGEMIGLLLDDKPIGTPTIPIQDTRRKISGANVFRNSRQTERSFGVTKLGHIALLNIRRLVYSDPESSWNPITSHLLAVQRHTEAPNSIRLQAADVLDRIILLTPKLIANADESLQRRIQTQVVAVLARQAEPEDATPSTTDIEVRKVGFDTLFKILENNGHSFVAGWKLILDVLRTACPPATRQPSVIPAAPPTLKRPTPAPSGTSTSKLSIIVRTSFPSLQLICTDFLTALTLEELQQCISVLAEFGNQMEDINIALTSGGLLWQVSDHVQGKNKSAKPGDDSYVRLWMYLLSKLLELSRASRQEVRDGAIQTLFRTIGLYGTHLSAQVWHELLWKVIYPLLDHLSEMIEQTPCEFEGALEDNLPADVARQPNAKPIQLNAKQLDDSKILALESVGKVVADHLSSHILTSPEFRETWSLLIQHLQNSFIRERPQVGTTAMKTLSKILNAEISGDIHQETVSSAWKISWDSFVKMSEIISTAPSETVPKGIYFTQASLEAYILVARPVQKRLQLNLERIKKLLEICQVVISYVHSPDYRPDVDTLPPVPLAALAAIDEIDLSSPGFSSAVIHSLSTLVALPFVSPFEVPDPFSSRVIMRVSYIALFKAVQPKLTDLIERFRDKTEIYSGDAVAHIFTSLAMPLKLKYDCPASSRHPDSSPLWKIASATLLKVVKSCLPCLAQKHDCVPLPSIEKFWSQLVETFSVALLADCKPSLAFELEQQRMEENFDLALVASLELDVLPYLGHTKVPDHVIRALCLSLQAGSRLYDLEFCSGLPNRSSPGEPEKVKSTLNTSPVEDVRFIHDFGTQAKKTLWGTSAEVIARPRERFAYWCFDLLFEYCSRVTVAPEVETERRRVASIALPILLDRCAAVIKAYIADAPIRGQIPFPRLREEEILYILRQLLTVVLWDQCLPADFRAYYQEPPPEPVHVSDHDNTARKISSQAKDGYLLYLQPLLISLLSGETLCPSNKFTIYNLDVDNNLSVGPDFLPYRDLLQAQDQNGSGLQGHWPELMLGQVGILLDRHRKYCSQDLRQLVMICFHRTSALTTLNFGL